MSGESVFSDAGTVSSYYISPSLKRRKRIIRTAVGVAFGILLIICVTTGVVVSRSRSRRSNNSNSNGGDPTLEESDEDQVPVLDDNDDVPTSNPTSLRLETISPGNDDDTTMTTAFPSMTPTTTMDDTTPTVEPTTTLLQPSQMPSMVFGSTGAPSGSPTVFPTSATPTFEPSSSPTTPSPTAGPSASEEETDAPTTDGDVVTDSPTESPTADNDVTTTSSPTIVASPAPTTTSAAFEYTSEYLDLVIVVGGVTTSSAKIMVRTTESAQVQVLYGTTYGDLLTRGTLTDASTTDSSTDYTTTIQLDGLSSFLKYYYRIIVNDSILHDPGYLQEFTTFPSPGGYDEVTVAIYADAANVVHDRDAPAYRQMPASTILAMQIGDMDHSDPTTLEESRQMHRSLLSPLMTNHGNDLTQGALSRMAFDHTWDDHDYCGQDTDKTCPSKATALQAYKEYFPTYNLPTDAIYHKFPIGDAEFFVLDTRSQRDPDLNPDTADKSVLGATQKQWLFDGLVSSERTWKIVISSISANTSAQTHDNIDHWMASFTTEAQEIRVFLEENNLVDTTFMVSGDLHTGGGIDDGTNNGWGIVELGVAHTNLAAGNGANLGTWNYGVTSGNNGNGGFATIRITSDEIELQTRNAEGDTRQWLTMWV
mmetsp:Transcript_27179/g.39799  ORF Transcript_27179/g.39799 Transcript_27179/m.39799 type:complete len:650 (-) Transcript_27179:345-2294(-)|eukprot:CAMPEP_0194037224 /NCGR_PEP_ID=MMETSP0009_2-20130614/9558_1 /TAXON_ID=210454 /ORGANISM="Grammatophora oceanica, Strain CCMP 410" /LENGTH=649 /DNA_ID=CAMNT_0038679291 /DNA_START=126 /DNA_END=2075 /DNA_ORIENTATION=+